MTHLLPDLYSHKHPPTFCPNLLISHQATFSVLPKTGQVRVQKKVFLCSAQAPGCRCGCEPFLACSSRKLWLQKKRYKQAAPNFKLVPGLGGGKLLEVYLSHECSCEGALHCLTTFLKCCFHRRRVTTFENMKCTTLSHIYTHTYLLTFKSSFAIHFS